MFVEERHRRILQLLEENDKVLVKELSKMFGVSDDCIRKDLASMEERQLLKRAYGGAVKVSQEIHAHKVDLRRNQHVKEKRQIAKKAMKLIKDGDTVFLDISTTNLELAKELIKSEKNVMVVTNMLGIANLFADAKKENLVLLGGKFDRNQNGFIGSMTTKVMEQYYFDLAFLGVVGIDLEKKRITTYMPDDGICKHMAIEHAKKSYLMVETMKFDLDGNYIFCKSGEISGFICDQPVSDTVAELLAKDGIEIL